MTQPHEANARAWLPLTPRGVAAFARAPLRRLFLVQFLVALLAAAAVVWFVDTDWSPAIRAAILQLPARGEIHTGRLIWPGPSPQLLADRHYLAFAVDLDHTGGVRGPAQVQVEFGRDDVWIFSLFGYTECAYPKQWIIGFNRPELEPWWGAWRPPFLGITFGTVIVGLLASWALLATVYCLPTGLVAFYSNRDLDWRASWKLAGAAMLPGALLVVAAILLYGGGILDLVQFVAVGGAHVVVGWLYCLAGLWFVPKLPAGFAGKGNPFARPPGAGS
jgi:hypothetical protein